MEEILKGRNDMRRVAAGFVVLLATGSLVFLAPQIQSQSQSPRDGGRGTGGRGVGARGAGEQAPDRQQGDPRGRGGPGGFPPPPVMAALDADNDGEISPDELKNASMALKKLDKNKDGQIVDSEMVPDFGGGPPGGFGGGPPGGFGGRGGPGG